MKLPGRWGSVYQLRMDVQALKGDSQSYKIHPIKEKELTNIVYTISIFAMLVFIFLPLQTFTHLFDYFCLTNNNF